MIFYYTKSCPPDLDKCEFQSMYSISMSRIVISEDIQCIFAFRIYAIAKIKTLPTFQKLYTQIRKFKFVLGKT
jgi:hypothetical protein